MKRLLLALLLLSLTAPAAHAARAWQSPIQLSGAGDTWSGDAAVAPDGRVVAAWTERAGEIEQAWLTVRPGLAPVVLDAAARRPQVAIGGTDEAVVAWERDVGPGLLPRTYAALWTEAGGLG